MKELDPTPAKKKTTLLGEILDHGFEIDNKLPRLLRDLIVDPKRILISMRARDHRYFSPVRFLFFVFATTYIVQSLFMGLDLSYLERGMPREWADHFLNFRESYNDLFFFLSLLIYLPFSALLARLLFWRNQITFWEIYKILVCAYGFYFLMVTLYRLLVEQALGLSLGNREFIFLPYFIYAFIRVFSGYWLWRMLKGLVALALTFSFAKWITLAYGFTLFELMSPAPKTYEVPERKEVSPVSLYDDLPIQYGSWFTFPGGGWVASGEGSHYLFDNVGKQLEMKPDSAGRYFGTLSTPESKEHGIVFSTWKNDQTTFRVFREDRPFSQICFPFTLYSFSESKEATDSIRMIASSLDSLRISSVHLLHLPLPADSLSVAPLFSTSFPEHKSVFGQCVFWKRDTILVIEREYDYEREIISINLLKMYLADTNFSISQELPLFSVKTENRIVEELVLKLEDGGDFAYKAIVDQSKTEERLVVKKIDLRSLEIVWTQYIELSSFDISVGGIQIDHDRVYIFGTVRNAYLQPYLLSMRGEYSYALALNGETGRQLGKTLYLDGGLYEQKRLMGIQFTKDSVFIAQYRRNYKPPVSNEMGFFIEATTRSAFDALLELP